MHKAFKELLKILTAVIIVLASYFIFTNNTALALDCESSTYCVYDANNVASCALSNPNGNPTFACSCSDPNATPTCKIVGGGESCKAQIICTAGEYCDCVLPICSDPTPCGTYPDCSAPICSSSADCDDANSCTTDTCNNAGTCSASCSHTNNPVNGSNTCDTYSPGGGSYSCKGASCGGTCSNVPDCSCSVACSSSADCDDANSCTTDTCNNAGTCSASCSHTNNPVNGGWTSCSTTCGTGSRSCTSPSPSCGGTTCSGGTSCSDYSGCSYSWQSVPGSCVACNQANTVWCQRSDGATVADTFCGGGKPATSQTCNEGLSCGADGSCNQTGQTCSGTKTHPICSAGTCNSSNSIGCTMADSTSCSDSNSCTSGDTCNSGVCSGTNNPVNGGWSGCSTTCGTGIRTCTNPAPSCGGSDCSGGTSCTDNSGCATYHWHSSPGACNNSTCQQAVSVWCENSSHSTVADSNCDPGTKPATSNSCNEAGSCGSDGSCTQTGQTCSGTKTHPVCSSGSCNSGNTIGCTMPNNTSCSDGNGCTTGDICGSGACTGINNPVNGSCGGANNSCLAGTLNDTPDDVNNYLWQCVGSCGGATASCSVPKAGSVNGVCGGSTNTCNAGTFSDTADGACTNNWNCTGSGGGSTANCSTAKATTYSWQTSGWGLCSACSQFQTVWCQRACDGATVSDALCGGGKPAASQACNEGGTCNDGNACTNPDTCTSGTCSGPNICSAVPAITLSTNTMSFSAISGGPAPSGQTFTVRNSGSVGSTLKWRATTNQNWCFVNGVGNGAYFNGADLVSGATSPNLTVTMSAPSNVGTFTCIITVSDNSSLPAASNSPQSINVTYNVQSAVGSCNPGALRSCGLDYCVGFQQCQAGGTWGECSSSGLVCTGAGQCMYPGTCNAAGTCSGATPKPNTTSCSMGRDCYIGATCWSGTTCWGGYPDTSSLDCEGSTYSYSCLNEPMVLSKNSIYAGETMNAFAPSGWRSNGGTIAISDTSKAGLVETLYDAWNIIGIRAKGLSPGIVNISSLSPDSTHRWQDSNGYSGGMYYGPWSNCSFSAQLTVLAGGNVTATNTACSIIKLNWTPAANAVSYSILRATHNNSTFDPVASNIGNVSTYNDTTAVPGLAYDYYVEALDSSLKKLAVFPADTNTNGIVGTACVINTPTLTPPPTNSGLSCGTVRIGFVDNSIGEDGFKVYRNTTGNPPTSSDYIGKKDTVSKDTTGTAYTYDDTTGTAGTPYYYWVSAYTGPVLSPTVESSKSGGSSGAVPVSCDADLGVTNKDIAQINGVTPSGYAVDTCGVAGNQSPPGVVYKIGDIIAYQINICAKNTMGGYSATSISITDTMSNLGTVNGTVPNLGSTTAELIAAYGMSVTLPLHIQSVSVVSVDYPSSVKLNIVFNPGDALAPGTSAIFTMQAKTSLPPSFSGTSSRFQNGMSVTYDRDGTGPGVTTSTNYANTPLLMFRKVIAPSKVEVAP